MKNANTIKLIEIFNRRYALALLAILLSEKKKSQNAPTLESIYNRWSQLRPSRSTFSRLINDMARNDIIYLKASEKKSAKTIEITKNFLSITGLNRQISFDQFLREVSRHLFDD